MWWSARLRTTLRPLLCRLVSRHATCTRDQSKAAEAPPNAERTASELPYLAQLPRGFGSVRCLLACAAHLIKRLAEQVHRISCNSASPAKVHSIQQPQRRPQSVLETRATCQIPVASPVCTWLPRDTTSCTARRRRYRSLSARRMPAQVKILHPLPRCMRARQMRRSATTCEEIKLPSTRRPCDRVGSMAWRLETELTG